MRLIFAGTPEIAVPSLRKIAREFEICAVLTGADKKAGRGHKIHLSPVKQAAVELKLPVYQPLKFETEIINHMSALNADLLVVAAYWKIFPKPFLDIFPLGGINLHPSLLPKFRGASPIPATILAGEPVAGVTIQRLALKMDAGDILLQETIPLDGRETTASLMQTCAVTGADMMIRVLHMIASGHCEGIPQDHSRASYCKLIRKEEGELDWQQPAGQLERKIRAFFPWPGAFTFFEGKRLVIHAATLYAGSHDKNTGSPGLVTGVDKQHGLLVQTGDGLLAVTRLQLQSKKAVDFKSFVNGHSKIIGSCLGV
jgi:methionyl-tRNA formyltransferase